ncbi:hypothetical protein predicted by Glimmer/Critica [Sorangium cellulosum So ce56]|uniref:Secreted protein n=1 Tax=Sorangium cellulosum (strain So ce56) TaxID=448385 RepID=A9F2K8_SORC5|nr:hypothetical protein [Sorangium cellulosum]CAN94496.1 hypothetical protein predicted by Glimmer/Critica [Sorangium cellulosum So ce56]
MRSSKRSAVTLALAALAPGLNGCAEIAGLEDRQVIPLIVIAQNQAKPRAIALDEEAIYWTNGRSDGAQGSSTGGALRRQIKDDWEVVDLLAPSSEVPGAIALDATHIYWSSTDAAFEGECVSADGDDRDKLWKLPKAAPVPAAGGELLWGSCGAAEAIALSADNVYSARPNADRITWVPKRGGTRKDLTEAGGEPRGVATDGPLVYWTDPAENTLSVIDTSSDALEEELLSNLTDPGLLVLDEANLYWLTGDNVMRYARSGAAGDVEVPLLEDGLPSPPTGIATYGDYLYITVKEAGSVYRLRKGGAAGAPEVIAANQGGPTGIAADGTGVYWTNSVSGQIVRFSDE